MKRLTGREMKKLVLAVTLMTLALVLGVIAYFMIDVILTTNSNIEKNKQMTLDKTVLQLKGIAERVGGISSNPRFLDVFNQENLQKIMMGDEELLHQTAVAMAAGMNPLEYAAVIEDGKVMAFEVRPGVQLDADQIPADVPEGEYEVVDRLGDNEGYYVVISYPIDLSSFGLKPFVVEFAIDRTAEMQEIEAYFTEQRDDLILRMSIASVIAILLTLLITTFGLRYFTSKYVTEPIDRLNRMAEDIADGKFEGEVEVDSGSAYAALQGLLRSGQLILRKMDKEIEE